MKRLALLGILITAVSATARASEFNPSFAEIDFAAARAVPQAPPAGSAFAVAPGAYGAPLHTIPLAPLLDQVSPVSFRSGGVNVRLFGGISENKNNWFTTFVPDNEAAMFFQGRAMLRWHFVFRGVAHFEIGPRKYDVHLDGNAIHPMESRLVVSPKDRAEAPSSWSLQELADKAYSSGVLFKIRGQEYSLMYTRDFNEDDHGHFDKYTGDRSITLVFHEGDRLFSYHWYEREIPSGSILISTPDKVDADKAFPGIHPGTLTVGLRLNNGALEIYEAGSPASKK